MVTDNKYIVPKYYFLDVATELPKKLRTFASMKLTDFLPTTKKELELRIQLNGELKIDECT